MSFWQWLFGTGNFQVPQGAGGWAPALVTNTVAANALLALVYTAIPLLLVSFVFSRSRQPRYFRDRRLAGLFAAFLFACGITHALRAASFYWPAYRLAALVGDVTALISFATVVLMVPLLSAEPERLRQERHDFANKAHVSELQMAINLKRIERTLEATRAQQLVIQEAASILARLPKLMLPLEEVEAARRDP